MDLNDISILQRAQSQLQLRESAEKRLDFDLHYARTARIARLTGKPSVELLSTYETQVAYGAEESIETTKEILEAAENVLIDVRLKERDDV